MAREDSAAVLVARFLRQNNYEEEAGLPPDAGSSSKGSITIEQVLQEKKVFDLSVSFEKTGIDDGDKSWSTPAPSKPELVGTLPSDSNILHVSVERIAATGDGEASNALVVSAADKTLAFLDPSSPYTPIERSLDASDSPLLSCASLSGRYLVASSMSGKVYLHDLQRGRTVDSRRDHQKYVVKSICHQDESGSWVATAAWDAKVFVYRLRDVGGESCALGDAVAQVELPTNPESILFIKHPEIATPVLLLSRRDSTFLYYYALPDGAGDGTKALVLLGRQNLAPHSNAWIAFTPSALALSPRDPLLLAVATSAVPHMKLIIVRLLLPPPQQQQSAGGVPTATVSGRLTQASQAREELALQDREASAILIHCTTLAPQTAYSTPALAWRPDSSGVFVNGDDGVLRGLETTTGKIAWTLKGGHDPGSKIRCLWAGFADAACEREIVVSGGFDKRLIVWNAT